jgi:peptidoglycan/LPS O-acetylase OafA/YrhL
MKFADIAKGRDNNFNLIRILAAYAVLLTHSFALAIGPHAEPFRDSLGMTMGAIAVDVFFIISGILVTASLLTRQSFIDFVWARALRIYPALFVMLLITVLVLGPVFTTLPLEDYFASPETLRYFRKCLTLFGGVAYELPGVFNSNPYKNAVNGSLWSMPPEVRIYAFMSLLWLALQVLPKIRFRMIKIIILLIAYVSGIHSILGHVYFNNYDIYSRLFFMFYTGASFYVLRDKIVISKMLFWLCAFGMVVSASINVSLFYVVYSLAVAYVVFFIAYVPSGRIRKYNLAGDYSYGVYIYAFPVQQSVAALIPGASVGQMIIISSLVTLIFAAFSWHLIEERALNLKLLYINRTKAILGIS